MKNFKFLIVLFVFVLFFSGCKNEFSLSDYVSINRQNIYTADYKSVRVTAYFEVSETPQVFDGVKSKTAPQLTFKLPVSLSQGDYQIECFDAVADFKLDAVKNVLVATIPVTNAPVDGFDATVILGSERTTLNFKSEVPTGIITYNKALDSLYSAQKSYLDGLKTDGGFKAEIILKITVHKGVPYYYVAVADTNGGFKALLIDAYTAEVLAIRNVY